MTSRETRVAYARQLRKLKFVTYVQLPIAYERTTKFSRERLFANFLNEKSKENAQPEVMLRYE